jgi:glutamyl-Q tRNA(Asp) synthetase
MGSLVAAMASYLDAKVHQGTWLLRIEDLDYDRNVDGADAAIVASLQRCGMAWDGEATWQSRRLPLYQAALMQLQDDGLVYACGCSRKEIQDSLLQAGAGRHGAAVYPGTCRHGLAPGKEARGLRLRVPDGAAAVYDFVDRWHGAQRQDLADEVGDFIVLRGDGYWAYQLAVVVDDGEQGVTQVVRGADLLDSTPRQLYLQDVLGLPHPGYLHVPVVNNALGEKLSKQTGALAFDTGTSAADLLASALLPAAHFLGLDLQANNIDDFWRRAIPAWALRLSKQP